MSTNQEPPTNTERAREWLGALQSPDGRPPMFYISPETIGRWRSLEVEEEGSDSSLNLDSHMADDVADDLVDDREVRFYFFGGDEAYTFHPVITVPAVPPSLPPFLNAAGVALINVVLFLSDYTQNPLYRQGHEFVVVLDEAINAIAGAFFSVADYLYAVEKHIPAGREICRKATRAGRGTIEASRCYGDASEQFKLLARVHDRIRSLPNNLKRVDTGLRQFVTKTEDKLTLTESGRAVALSYPPIDLPTSVDRALAKSEESILITSTEEILAYYTKERTSDNITELDAHDLLVAHTARALMCLSLFQQMVEGRRAEWRDFWDLVSTKTSLAPADWQRVGLMYDSLDNLAKYSIPVLTHWGVVGLLDKESLSG